MSTHAWRSEYQLLLKGFTDKEPQRFVLRTDAEVVPGHTFRLGDGNVAIVGDVDAENVWATYWLFDRVNDIPVELVPLATTA